MKRFSLTELLLACCVTYLLSHSGEFLLANNLDWDEIKKTLVDIIAPGIAAGIAMYFNRDK